MTLPKENFTIKVGPYTYSVEYNTDIAHGTDTLGSCHKDTLKIFLDPRLHPLVLEETFLHEALHALCSVSNLDINLEDGDTKRDVGEEELVSRLSTVLFQFIIDNPELFR